MVVRFSQQDLVATLEREQGVGFWISSAHTRFATADPTEEEEKEEEDSS